jgi:predicted HTH transcriptional regulator
LEALLAGPLDETGLTDAAVRALVAQQVRESEVLEFKAQPYPGAPPGASLAWTAEQELAKDITALANTAGGLLLIGVQETAGAASAGTPFPDDPEAVVQRLGRALVNHSAPVPRVEWIPVPATGGGHYLAVVVPPSPLAPHAVTGQRGDSRRPLHWYVRDGSDSRPLPESEVAERYRTRFRGADDRQARRDRVGAEGRDALGRSDLLWLWTASVPHAPRPRSPRRPSRC